MLLCSCNLVSQSIYCVDKGISPSDLERINFSELDPYNIINLIDNPLLDNYTWLVPGHITVLGVDSAVAGTSQLSPPYKYYDVLELLLRISLAYLVRQ